MSLVFRIVVATCCAGLIWSVFPAELAAEQADPSDSTDPVATRAAEPVPADPDPAEPESNAAATAADSAATPAPAPSADETLLKAINDLKAQIDDQSTQLALLQTQYLAEVQSRQSQIEAQKKTIDSQTGEIDTQRQAIQSLQQQVDQISATSETELTDDQKQIRSRLETVEASIDASQKAESTEYDVTSFPGSLAIPGTSAAFRIGGFVKGNMVTSLDPIGTDDRFIVGTIPVPNTGGQSQTKLTATQSRVNFDLRDSRGSQSFRAFVEGDFAGAGDTFRLRHAFGQYKDVMVGQTWTTFMDFDAVPEDLDFEGINGKILVRQTQIRYSPKIGKQWNLMISAEDTSPEIQGGKGVSRWPDLVISVRRSLFDKWHIKSALLLRQLDGECGCLDGAQDNTNGWGFSISGNVGFSLWDERDNVIFQLSFGEGFGRYVNDLGTIGSQDAVFNPQTGKLHALPVFSSFIALQKWWTTNTRTNFNVGYVEIDNFDFQDDSEYHKTFRFGGNYIWSPIARVDLGAELLWGERTDLDGQSAAATQIQLSAKYRY